MERLTETPRLEKLLQCVEEAVSAAAKDAPQIIDFFRECDALGLEIRPLDCNRSAVECAIEDATHLRLGFSALGFGKPQFIEDILTERQQHGLFTTFQNFCERVALNDAPTEFWERSIAAGVFDSTGPARASLLAGYAKVLHAVRKFKAERAAPQISLFAMLPATSSVIPLVSLPDTPAWSEAEQIEHEIKALGFSLTEYWAAENQAESDEIVEADALPEEAVSVMAAEPVSPDDVEIAPPSNVVSVPQKFPESPILESEPPVAPIQVEATSVTAPVVEAISLAEILPTSPRAFVVRLPLQIATDALLLQLREICGQHGGQHGGTTGVVLELVDAKHEPHWIQAHSEYRVTVSDDLTRHVEALNPAISARLYFC